MKNLTLKEKVLDVIEDLLVSKEYKPKYKDIYNFKTIFGELLENCFISFRFKKSDGTTFVLSLIISTVDDFPVAKIIISVLDQKRFFFRSISKKSSRLLESELLSVLLEKNANSLIMLNNKTLPSTILLNIYQKYCKESLIKTLTKIEEVKICYKK